MQTDMQMKWVLFYNYYLNTLSVVAEVVIMLETHLRVYMTSTQRQTTWGRLFVR